MKNWIALVLIALAACDAGNTGITEQMNITYFEKGSEELIDGQYLVVQARYQTTDGRVIMESQPFKPILMKYDQLMGEEGGQLQEVLNILKVGDSVYFEIPADNLFEVTFNTDVPDSINRADQIQFYMSINDQLDQDQYYDFVADINDIPYEEEYEEEYQQLLQYLSENNIETQSTASGVHYVIDSDKEGDVIQVSDTVTVFYTGSILKGEETFDSGDLSFVSGSRKLIEGLDEGIRVLSEGDEATFYIPSKEAYGYRGSGKLIAPFSTLVFEVEVKKVN